MNQENQAPHKPPAEQGKSSKEVQKKSPSKIISIFENMVLISKSAKKPNLPLFTPIKGI